MTGRALTSLDVADRIGVTYRQLDHWLRKGYIRAGGGQSLPGSGYGRRWSDAEVEHAARVATFVKALEVPPSIAALLATVLEPGGPLWHLPGGVVVGYWPGPARWPPLDALEALGDDEQHGDDSSEGA